MINYDDIKSQIIISMKNVEQQYYTPLVAKSELTSDTIKRERNYCYELYHQLRSNKILMEMIKENYTFSSEIDKRGHELFEDDLIPDFILHRPGKMSFENKDNLLVIEVKVVLDSNSYDGIAKDFYNLSLMLSEYGYQYGIFILINHDLNEFKRKFRYICNKSWFANMKENQKEKFSEIDIICSKEEGKIDSIITLEKLMKEADL